MITACLSKLCYHIHVHIYCHAYILLEIRFYTCCHTHYDVSNICIFSFTFIYYLLICFSLLTIFIRTSPMRYVPQPHSPRLLPPPPPPPLVPSPSPSLWSLGITTCRITANTSVLPHIPLSW
jgi:hypothetical protein